MSYTPPPFLFAVFVNSFAFGKICQLCDFVCFLVVLAEIFATTSAIRPRADVAYCIHALARRLAKTRNWTVRFLPKRL